MFSLRLIILYFRQFVRNTATTSVGQKCLDIPCKAYNKAGRPCRGKLHDNILDWEHDLPQSDLDLSTLHSRYCLE